TRINWNVPTDVWNVPVCFPGRHAAVNIGSYSHGYEFTDHSGHRIACRDDDRHQDPHTISLAGPSGCSAGLRGSHLRDFQIPGWRDRLAELYARLLSQIAVDYPVARLRESIDAGLTALKSWKNASSRKLAPRELTHREVITDFMVSDLPTGPREFLASHAKELVKQQNLLISGHHMRPGIPEFVAECQRRDI